MREWDGLVGGYLAEKASRGCVEQTIRHVESELHRLGLWLKRRRPRPNFLDVDRDLMVSYLRSRTHFRARTTVASVISAVRCFSGSS